MRVVIQRVLNANVKVEEKLVSKINSGLLVLLGIVEEDNQEDINFLVRKITNLRIFNDENNVMNKSLLETQGDVIVVSQFTLHASTKKGNRPSYIKAAKPDIAVPIYNDFLQALENKLGKKVQTGIFGAEMKVELVNDGPVTILIDSKSKE